MPDGPTIILILKILVSTVTVLFAGSLVALAAGRVRLHGLINKVFFALTLTTVLGFELLLRLGTDVTSQFSDEARAALKVHLYFAVPSALLLPVMLLSGVKRRRVLHVSVGVGFLALWTGTFVTGVFFLPAPVIGYNGAMPTADDHTTTDSAAPDLSVSWQVDGEEALLNPETEPECTDPSPGQPPHRVSTPNSEFRTPDSSAPPPPVDRIVEAMLFVGGPPLTVAHARSAVRGMTPERFREVIDGLNRTYRVQGRPYAIRPAGEGYSLGVKPAYRTVREKLFGGPREARLSQPALDVLALIAYRQPVGKGEVDAVRGADSGSVLRQLVRLGLVAVVRRGDADRRDVAYGTTARFLDLFGLTSADDLPRLGEPQAL